MTAGVYSPREINVADRSAVGRIGEIISIRPNEMGGGGRIVRVPTDTGALDIFAECDGKKRIDGILQTFDEERIQLLAPGTLASVEEFAVTPSGLSCARLHVSLLSRMGKSAWCLLKPCGPALDPVVPPISTGLQSSLPELRTLRARHPAFYACACSTEVETLDRLSICRDALEISITALRDGFEEGMTRGEQERGARELEAAFVALRIRLERSPSFRSLTSTQRDAIASDAIRIDFDRDIFA